jgi:exoribonuclease-2
MQKHHQTTEAVDLKELAHREMVDYSFEPDFSKECQNQLQKIEASTGSTASSIKDLRNLLWSSIDNIESQDLDQIEYTERLPNGDIKLLVGIADVDSSVTGDTPLDQRAANNCFSIYTGVITFPMFPTPLSEGITSLLQDQDRQCMITEMVISKDGTIKSSDVYRALVRNKAKLAYEPVSDWLDGKGDLAQLKTTPGLEEQLKLQNELADWLYDLHHRSGELTVQTIEAQPVMENGTVLDMQVREQNRAREIIKNFMISANIALAEFLRDKKSPLIERVVREPKRWPRLVELAQQYNFKLPAEPDPVALNNFVSDRKNKDPEHFPDLSLTVVKLLGPGEYIVQLPNEPSTGHFGLAVHEYTHSTAPNRRFPDLVTQRLVKALLSGKPSPYSDDDLKRICDQCVDREEAARKLERFMRKVAAAVLLGNQIGKVYDAIVTGASSRGTYVRLKTPPAEGRVVKNEHGLDVGDRCRVKLVSTDPAQGFIDFERVN